MSTILTTAAALLALDKELREGGMAGDIIDDIVRAAARGLTHDGELAVREVTA